ncbi:hypothetical protein BH11PSE11_BH11PSE11_13200 [soil metagenome]
MLKTSTLPDAPLVRIPFLIFVHIADDDKQITAREADAFAGLLEKPNWCRSALLKQALQQTGQHYAELWKAYANSEISADAEHLAEAMLQLEDACQPDEISAVYRDLGHLASVIASSSAGMLGSTATSRRKQAAREFVIGLMSVAPAGTDSTGMATRTATGVTAASVEGQEGKAARAASGADIKASDLWPLAAIGDQHLPVWGKGRIQVRCVKVIDETHDVKTFKFAAVQPTLFLHSPGQFATLELPIDGKTVRRSYTISSTPSRPHTMSITVKRVPGGQVSNWLHDNMREGQEIFTNGPNGKFNLFDIPARKLLLLSGGSGITPVMSMLRWLMDTNADCDVIFITSARTPIDVIFQRELELYDSQFSHLKVAVACSAPHHGRSWLGYTGHLNRRMLEMIAPDYIERTAYVCGPAFFMDAMKQTLLEMGLPSERYFQESFGAPKGNATAAAAAPATSALTPLVPVLPQTVKAAAPIAATSAPVQATAVPMGVASKAIAAPAGVVVFTLSGKEVACNDGEGILDAAERHGLELSSSCRAGSCGTCKQKKVDGVVHMDVTDGLTDDDIAQGFVLICIGRPEGRVSLEA